MREWVLHLPNVFPQFHGPGDHGLTPKPCSATYWGRQKSALLLVLKSLFLQVNYSQLCIQALAMSSHLHYKVEDKDQQGFKNLYLVSPWVPLVYPIHGRAHPKQSWVEEAI